jgi:hypothetical protein
MKQTHKIKRIAQFLGIKTYKMFNPKYTLSEYERECVNICRTLIEKEGTTLLMSPSSGKRYIRSEDNQVFIVIQDRHVTIVNHMYSYDISVADASYNKIKLMFDNQVENRRTLMENEIRANVKHSLHTIYKSLTNETA